ncbi:MAG TPA: hypothetical protein VI653_00865 [Steroidobacteraceae bacterium]
MPEGKRSWIYEGLSEEAWDALAVGLPAARLWSVLLAVMESRATRRTAPRLCEQWERDRFVQPCHIDQRTLHEVDGHLLAVAREFEAVELSPLAPLGVCSAVALASQNKIVSTARGTEVVSDPTNVLALECARRLKENGELYVRLASSHRCVRAQAYPKESGLATHFRMFCLASAGHERENRAFLTGALAEHINTHLAALARLQQHGYLIRNPGVRLLATAGNVELAQRVAASVNAQVQHEALKKTYYDGIRFMIDVTIGAGKEIPLIDGGAFDWLRKLCSNNKLTFVASGMGSQLIASLSRPL